jgi:hypothetical protein
MFVLFNGYCISTKCDLEANPAYTVDAYWGAMMIFSAVSLPILDPPIFNQ